MKVTAATVSNIEGGRSRQVRRVVYAKWRRALRLGPATPEVPVAVDEDFTAIVEGVLDLDEKSLNVVRTLVETLKRRR